jgi:hypothetical protein
LEEFLTDLADTAGNGADAATTGGTSAGRTQTDTRKCSPRRGKCTRIMRENITVICRYCENPMVTAKDTPEEDWICINCQKWRIPYHTKCGLPVELCTCSDAAVKYDEKTGSFTVRIKPEDIIGPAD